MNKTGQKISALRKENNISQEDLAFSLDVSRQTISKRENGAASPSAENIVALCKLFKVDYAYLLDDYAENPVPQANDTVEEMLVKKRGKSRILAALLIIFAVCFAVFAILSILTAVAAGSGAEEGAIESITAIHIADWWPWFCGAGGIACLCGLVATIFTIKKSNVKRS